MVKPSDLLAKNVSRALEKLGWSQTKLAKEVGVAQPQMSGWLTGKSMPGIDAAGKIADALGLKLSELFETEMAPNPRIEQHEMTDELRQVIREELARAEPPDGPRAELVALLPTLDDSQVSLYLEMAREHLRTLGRALPGAMPQRQKKNQGK